MNQIRAIQALNKKEIENGVPPEASWHTDYRDTAYVNFGGLPYELSEGDIITIFSQFGEPVFLKLIRDQETGKSKGFGWLKYEDQRSTDLAVDNLGGAEIGGRLVRVDHARYKVRDDEDPEEGKVGWEDVARKEGAPRGSNGSDRDSSGEESEKEKRVRPLLREEKELMMLIEGHDDDDPMKSFMIDEKTKEVEEALEKERKRSERHSKRPKDRHHRHHRPHRSRKDDDGDADRRKGEQGDTERRRRTRRDESPVESSRRDRDDRGEGRHRHRRDSRERRDPDRARDGDGDLVLRDRDNDDDDRRRDRDSRRRRHDREKSDDRYCKDRKRSRSRSPRRH